MEEISVWVLAKVSYLGLVFVTSFILTNTREALRAAAAPLVYDQVEPLPLHQKKENRSAHTANHAHKTRSETLNKKTG